MVEQVVKMKERWKMVNKNTNESLISKTLSRYGKVTNKKWKDSYSLKNLEIGEVDKPLETKNLKKKNARIRKNITG